MSTQLRYIRIPESQLNEGLANPMVLQKMFFEEEVAEERCFDPSATYQLMNFLLTGTLWEGAAPLGHTLFGSDTVAGIDESYGVFRYLRSPGVQAAWAALQPISPDELWSRFDLKAVQEAHPWPDNWTGSEEDRDYVLHHFTRLKSFYERAAHEREAIIMNMQS